MRVFVTGSAEGLGQMAAARLAAAGHEVVHHARNQSRARQALEATPGAADALVPTWPASTRPKSSPRPPTRSDALTQSSTTPESGSASL